MNKEETIIYYYNNCLQSQLLLLESSKYLQNINLFEYIFENKKTIPFNCGSKKKSKLLILYLILVLDFR
jgi:hypothetical protein